MTAVALPALRAPRALPVPVALGLREGLRIARHPLSLVAAALMVSMALANGDNGPRAAYDSVVTGPTFAAVFVYFAAHLVASRDRRSHSGELLAAVPAPATDRVAALCLGALVPAAVSVVLVVGVHALQLTRGLYEYTPTGWHVAQGPLTVLGAALLGIMVARLTGVPGAALLVMIAMVLVDAWLAGVPETLQPLATYVAWAVYGEGDAWVGLHPGSMPWHVAYLTGLCAMAAAGAFLREGPTRRVLLVGGVLTAVTLVPAVLQLP